MKGKNLDRYVTPDDWIIARGQARAGYENVFRDRFVKNWSCHKNGRVTLVMFNAIVYRDKSRTVIGVFTAARGVTNYT